MSRTKKSSRGRLIGGTALVAVLVLMTMGFATPASAGSGTVTVNLLDDNNRHGFCPEGSFSTTRAVGANPGYDRRERRS